MDTDRSPDYRPEIDGLRGFAVIAVVLYHSGVPGFSGGYVGVDIFFVISSFLISGKIREAAARGLSFREFAVNFYVRRTRRLLPALFCVVAAAFPISYILLPPEHLKMFSGSAIYSLVSLSNFYFYLEAGYWDLTNHVKPLLHTWSLSVEWQFYLLWPLLLWPLLRLTPHWVVPVAIASVGTVSLALAEKYLKLDQPAVFYMAPFRVVEFAIGGILTFVPKHSTRSPWVANGLAALSLTAITFPVFFYTHEVAFPGASALLPCFGAALAIYSSPARLIERLLTNKLIVGLGVISYSLYLVHWPLLVFWRYYVAREIGPADQFLLLFLAVFSAVAMYHGVERRFRNPSKTGALSPPGFGLVMTSITLVLVVPAATAWSQAGWPWRVPFGMRALHKATGADGHARRGNAERYKCHFSGDVTKDFAKFQVVLATCHTVKPKSIVVLGDSHAVDLYSALEQNLAGRNLIGFTGGGCSAASRSHCGELMSHALQFIEKNQASIDLVIYTQRGLPLLAGRTGLKQNDVDEIFSFLTTIGNLGKTVVWLGPQIEYVPEVPILLFRSNSVQEFVRIAPQRQDNRIVLVDSLLKASASGKPKVTYVSKLDSLCPAGTCPILDKKGKLIVLDYGHWTYEGAGYFSSHIVKIPILAGAIGSPVSAVSAPTR